jgi:hypothetical protein
MSDKEGRNTKNSSNSKIMESTLLRLEESFKKMDKKLDDNIKTLQQSIQDSKNELRDDIKNEILAKVEENSSKIEVNVARIADLEMQVHQLQDTVEANSRSTDLIVKGVPILGKENCTIIYQKIALAIGYSQDFIPQADTFRLGVKKPNAKFDPPLLFKFASKFEKDIFHQKYFDVKNLNLNQIGWNVDQRIIITENLTKSAQQIFSAAMALQREKKVHKASTSQGNVFVRHKEGHNRVRVKSLSDLDRYRN